MDLSSLRPRKHDLIIAAVIAAAVVCAFIILRAGSHTGAEAVVTARMNGEETEILRLPLDEDAETDIVTDLGTNHLVITGGRAYITEADCPDRICVTAWRDGICLSGETIICLPHRLYVTVEGDASSDSRGSEGMPDAVVN